MRIKSVLKPKYVAWAMGTLIGAIIVNFAVHSGAKASVHRRCSYDRDPADRAVSEHCTARNTVAGQLPGRRCQDTRGFGTDSTHWDTTRR
jgi:hypothetical protein